MDKKILATKGPKGFVAGEIVGMIFSGIMGFILLFLSPKELVIKLFSLIFIGCAIFCGYLAFYRFYLIYKNNICLNRTSRTVEDAGPYKFGTCTKVCKKRKNSKTRGRFSVF